MFNQTWKKYLPVITILLKRSVNGEQSLDMNHTDFERASGGRKMKWSFPVLQLNNGRIQHSSAKYPAVATEMLTEFQADEQISRLLKGQEFEFSMTNDFKLLIKNTSITEAAIENTTEEINNEAEETGDTTEEINEPLVAESLDQ